MNTRLRKCVNKLLHVSMVSGLLFANIISVAASDVKANTTDLNLLADLVSERHYLDQELADIGMSLDEIFELPQQDENFYAEVEKLTEGVLLEPITTYSNEETKQTTEAQRLKYAGEMAKWSVSQKPGRNYNQEVVYMYLSHYVDVPSPLSDYNGISNNSTGNVLAKYICQMDRNAYDIYLSKGASYQAVRNINNLVDFTTSSSDSAKDALNWIKDKKTLVGYIEEGIDTKLTIDSGGEALDAISNAMQNNISPEEITKSVTDSLTPKYGDKAEEIALESVAIVFDLVKGKATPFGMIITAAGITVDLSTKLLDQLNFISMRIDFSYRWDKRFSYFLYGKMS